MESVAVAGEDAGGDVVAVVDVLLAGLSPKRGLCDMSSHVRGGARTAVSQTQPLPGFGTAAESTRSTVWRVNQLACGFNAPLVGAMGQVVNTPDEVTGRNETWLTMGATRDSYTGGGTMISAMAVKAGAVNLLCARERDVRRGNADKTGQTFSRKKFVVSPKFERDR